MRSRVSRMLTKTKTPVRAGLRPARRSAPSRARELFVVIPSAARDLSSIECAPRTR